MSPNRATSGLPQPFLPGDKVRVGPAYVMGGSYRRDGWEGIWFVHEQMDALNYCLKRECSNDTWEVVMHTSRLAAA